MRHSFRIPCAAIGLWPLLYAASTGADETSLSTPRVTQAAQPGLQSVELVRSLGDSSFKTREAAASELVRLGRKSIPALTDGTHDPDLEVSQRCRRLLVIVDERDLSARVEAFISDTSSRSDHQVPGWHRFCLLVGDARPERDFFGAMLKAETFLFLLADSNPRAAAARLSNRCAALFEKKHSPNCMKGVPVSLAELAALVFVAGDLRLSIPAETMTQLSNLLDTPFIRQALTHTTPSRGLRRILLAWMQRQVDPTAVEAALTLAVNLEFRDGVGLALQRLRDHQADHGMSLVVVGKFGAKEHMPLLSPWLDDRTLIGIVQADGQRAETQIRDVALAMMIHLSGQSHKEYGFEFPPDESELPLVTAFVPISYGFGSDAKREAALARWKVRGTKK